MTRLLLVDRYRVDALLGTGGMGSVHAGFDTRLERRVAIKLLPEESETDTQARARFRREALAAAALDHPYICKVFEVGEHEGRSFIVMEHLEGRTLDAVIAERSLTPRQVLDLTHELAQALDEAHCRGIIHRDLKPSNIMLTTHGHVKVLDFGLAKQTSGAGQAGGAGGTVTDATAVTAADEVTRPGILLGTPSYMSPEQILGSVLDPRSDIFSLGVVLHELACGQHPFRKDSSSETMAAILRDAPRSTEADLDVVPSFGRIVHRMLAKGCAERPQTMRELIDMVDALRERGSSGSVGSGPALAPFAREERTQLVARDGELAELIRRLDQMLLGQGSIVLLGGEPGVGKTRLARELQRLAHERGCYSATGQCYESEGAPPFGPFIEAMEQAVRVIPQAVRNALGDVAAEMATMVPSLRRAYPDIPPALGLPAEQLRLAQFNAHLEYLRRATSRSPIVLLLDDLHWADDSSLQLLLHLAPHLAGLRMLVVGTYRDVELDTTRPFARVLETLFRQRLASRLQVRRLGEDGVRQMLEAAAGEAAPRELVIAVHRETDGNPFFVEEVFQHLRDEGQLFDASGGWKGDLRVEDIDVPEGVRLVISRRLDRLGDEARKVLTAAALIGRSFAVDVLLQVAAVDEEQVLDTLDAAAQAQLLAEEHGRDARYAFVHELIRGTLLAGLSLPRRQRLHVRVADALERVRGEVDVSMLAHHLYEAGTAAEPARTVKALTAALAQALETGAFEEGLLLVERLSAYEHGRTPQELARVDETHARLLAALGRLEPAIEPARRACTAWKATRDDEGIARTAVLGAWCTYWLARPDRSLAILRDAMQALSGAAGGELAELEAWAGNCSSGVGQLEMGAALLASASARAEALDNDRLRALVALNRGQFLLNCARPLDALREAHRALALDPLAGRAQAFGERAYAWLESGDVRAIRDTYEESEAHVRRVGDLGSLWTIRATIPHADFLESGDAAAWLRFWEAEFAHPVQWPHATRTLLATTAFLLGDAVRARSELEQARTERILETSLYAFLIDTALFAVSAWTDDVDGARAQWPLIAPKMPVAGKDALFDQWHGMYSAICTLALIGDRAEAAALYPATEYSLGHGVLFDVASVGPTTPLLSAAIAAECVGLDDRARTHYEDALALVTRVPARVLIPTVKMWFGRFLVARDEHSRGLHLLTEAADEFAAFHMPIHHERARRWIADAGRNRS